MLSKALPAARDAVAEAESNYELAVAAKKAAEDAAAAQLEASLSGEGTSVATVRPALDMGSKRRGVEAAQDALATARGAKQRLLDREDAIRRELTLARTVHMNAALQCLSEEVGSVLVARARTQMSEVTATLSALGWLATQHAAPDGAVGLPELRHTAPQHWPGAAASSASATAAMQAALAMLLHDPGAKLDAIKLG